MLKVAQYAAQLENYDRAIEIYEQVRKSVIISKRKGITVKLFSYFLISHAYNFSFITKLIFVDE